MGQRTEIAWAAVGIFGFILFLCAAATSVILSFDFFNGAPHAYPASPTAGTVAALVAVLFLGLALFALRAAIRRLKPFFRR